LINILLLRLGCHSENYEIQESFEAQFTHARGKKNNNCLPYAPLLHKELGEGKVKKKKEKKKKNELNKQINKYM